MADFCSFWYGDKLSGLEAVCIRSFLDWGHTFRLFTYNSGLVAPAGCKIENAREIAPEDTIFFYKDGRSKGKVSAFSNFFRYRLIYETGLCWVDTDVVCRRSSIAPSDYIFARQDETYFNGAILKMPRHHESMGLAAEYCLEVKDTAAWGDLGPRLVTKVIEEYDLEKHAWATNALYPVHWRDTLKLMDANCREEVAAAVNGATFLHLWNEIWSRNGIDKSVAPAQGSFLSEVFEQHHASDYF